jgi:hypothetical protein
MRLEKGVTRRIEFKEAKIIGNKECTVQEFAAKLIELGNSLMEYPHTTHRKIKCMWKGGIYLEIHATQPRKGKGKK